MKKLFLLTLLILTPLFANKVIYLNYEEVPTRVIKGEVFSITIKALSTVTSNQNINYTFSNGTGVSVINKIPYRTQIGKYLYDKFYFLVKNIYAKLPNVKAYLNTSEKYDSTLLRGTKLNVISLNPKQNFSNIIANSFELVEYKTTNYDEKHNIIIFVAKAENSDIDAIKFNNVYKQGIESSNNSYLKGRITYFVIIDKRVENFSFSYFNLLKNKFEIINIPIIVDDDSVSTQSDLKPKDQSKDKIKMFIAGILASILFIFVIWRKKYIYMILIIIPISYIVYLSIPAKKICIKEGSSIRILPVYNSTIFETTKKKYSLEVEGKTKGYTKVKFNSNKIGWIKDEDICTY